MTHFIQHVETWSNHFFERMKEFIKLSDIEQEANKKISKIEPPIDLDHESTFDVF